MKLSEVISIIGSEEDPEVEKYIDASTGKVLFQFKILGLKNFEPEKPKTVLFKMHAYKDTWYRSIPLQNLKDILSKSHGLEAGNTLWYSSEPVYEGNFEEVKLVFEADNCGYVTQESWEAAQKALAEHT